MEEEWFLMMELIQYTCIVQNLIFLKNNILRLVHLVDIITLDMTRRVLKQIHWNCQDTITL